MLHPVLYSETLPQQSNKKKSFKTVSGLENGRCWLTTLWSKILRVHDRFVSVKCSWSLSKDFKIVYCTSDNITISEISFNFILHKSFI